MAVLVFVRDQPIIIFNTQTHFSVIWNQRWEIPLNNLIDSYQLEPQKKENLLEKIQKGQDRRKEEMSRLIAFVKRITTAFKYPYVIMGDFNTTADTREIIDLVGELNLLDAYGVQNPQKKGYTWDPGRNTNTGYDASLFWADGVTPKDPLNRLKAEFDGNMARRIDFIFLSYQFEPDIIKEARLIFTEPSDGLFASDHFGIQVVLKRLP
jgi:endonuclease/exonuclease/phosphatase family metal-dependent hydrolase